MNCSKCGYQYENNMAACPLCGEPRGESAQEPYWRKPEEPAQPSGQQQQPGGQQQQAGGQWNGSRQYGGQQYDRPYQGGQVQHGVYGAQPQAGAEELSKLRSGATASLVCGILSLLIPFVGLALGIVAIIFGNKARKRLPDAEKGMATAGFALGIAGTVYSVFVIIMIILMVSMMFWMMMPFDTYYGSDYWYDGYGSDYWYDDYGSVFEDPAFWELDMDTGWALADGPPHVPAPLQ